MVDGLAKVEGRTTFGVSRTNQGPNRRDTASHHRFLDITCIDYKRYSPRSSETEESGLACCITGVCETDGFLRKVKYPGSNISSLFVAAIHFLCRLYLFCSHCYFVTTSPGLTEFATCSQKRKSANSFNASLLRRPEIAMEYQFWYGVFPATDSSRQT